MDTPDPDAARERARLRRPPGVRRATVRRQAPPTLASRAAEPAPAIRHTASGEETANRVWRRLALSPGGPPTVSQPEDPEEREADKVADRVMRTLADGAPEPLAVSGKAMEPTVHRGAPENASGHALDRETQAFFEPRLGVDLGRVRIRTDDEAARAFHARAFTVGSNIVFAGGEFAPASPSGRRLLAHELTHVAQHDRGRGSDARSADVSRPGDGAELEADTAARVVSSGGRFQVRQAPSAQISRDPTPPVAWGSDWFPSQKAPSGPPPQSCFEDPSAWAAAGAPAAFDKFIALTPGERSTVMSITYASGSLSKSLAALGLKSREPKYAPVVRDILVWIEKKETRQTTGKSDAEMAKVQATFIQADPKLPGSGWGGDPNPKTRWASLIAPEPAAWTARANAAIAKMVAYAATAAPELKVKAATFEFDPDAVDKTSKFAVATVGSKPGQTVMVGFEFVTQVEANPAYPLQFIVHELFGHVGFDIAGRTYQGDLFKEAAALTPAGTVADPAGTQTFNYWSSELYSWLLQIPYYKQTAAGDAAKVLDAPGNKTTVGKANWDPMVHAQNWLSLIKTKWEPSLVVGVMRGFYKRLANDPAVNKVSVTAFEGMVRSVFGADAGKILA